MSLKKKNSIIKNKDEDLVEEHTRAIPTHATSEILEEKKPTVYKDLKIVLIPSTQHKHFECIVGKHVFIDKPWTKISHKKIMEDLQLQNKNSCFWEFRKKLEGIKNENVLVGYKPFSNTDEEFVICITDKARQYIEETETRMESELKQKVEKSMLRVPGPWESKNSEKDIEEIIPIQTREKITYKWKLPAKRLQAKAEFENSNSKSMKNEYVKLEPRSKEIFEINEMLTMDSSVQAIKKMENKEMQTIPRIKDNKCIQSIAVEEEMFQLQPLTTPNKALDDFLEKHVPNLVNELRYNELYDLYRDDYKLLNNEKTKKNIEMFKNIKLLPGYQNLLLPKKYVSSLSWHPTIPGIFAVSYTTNSRALYKMVNIETGMENETKSSVKDENYEISYSNEEHEQKSWTNQDKLIGENYKEKIMSLLNKEFVQRMRLIQVNDDEKTNEQLSQDMSRELRNSLIYDSHEQPSTYSLDMSDSQLNLDQSASNQQLKIDNKTQKSHYLRDFDDDILNDENMIIDEMQIDAMDIDQWNTLNLDKELLINDQTDNNDLVTQNKEMKKTNASTINIDEGEINETPDHHDSDTDSFYNIWYDDEDWLYGNKQRNLVRNIHRNFNKKYDREAREEKLFEFLKSEAKYTAGQKKIEDMEKERMKLTKDMFEANDKFRQLKSQQYSKFKNKNKAPSTQYKILQNDVESKIKRENTPLLNEQNNSVVIWSIDNNIFPKLRLESPEEVCCVEFNPRDGNTVVGGLLNGQVCIWDIHGKLEAIDSSELEMSKLEIKHREHLWLHMKWSLDVNFKTKIKPAILSSLIDSHEAIITVIQWIHPSNEITSFGKFVTLPEDQFSYQFFSASMDGTIKLWNLPSTPESKQKNTTNTRFGYPENLNNYRSPLNMFNNRLKPTYTIIVMGPDSKVPIPITALSFEIPLMQYKYTSTQPLVIGKRQFEYIPTVKNDPNRIMVIGNMLGQIGVITWNGYEPHQKGQNVEEAKYIWWGIIHSGPINSIKRNPFFPDIHLVCGGYMVSIWSLNYKNGPIWWNSFKDDTNSVLWSTINPAEFRISFNSMGVLQFWNLMKYTHKPYYTFDFCLSDGIIATLSTPRPSMHFIGNEQFEFAEGLNEILNYNKNELISFSDSTGAIMMITMEAILLEQNEIEDIGRVFQKEVDWRKELDAWNEKYKIEYGSIGENNMDDRNFKSTEMPNWNQTEKHRSTTMTQEQINRQVCDETFRWYFNRKETKMDKNRAKYLEREKRFMIEAMMKKKNVTEKQLEDYFKGIENDKPNDINIKRIRFKDEEAYKEIINNMLAAEFSDEYVFDVDSKKSTASKELKYVFEQIHQTMVVDFAAEKEKLSEYVKNNPYKSDQTDWASVIEFAEKEIRDKLNDPTLLKNPGLRTIRRKLAKKYVDEGYKIKEWRNRKDTHACDRYKMRENKIGQLKAAYGKNYNPYWDKDLQEPQKASDAIRMRTTEEFDDEYGQNEQSYSYFEGEGAEGNGCYSDYLSLMEYNSVSSYNTDLSGRKVQARHDDGKGSTMMVESDDSQRKRWDAELFDFEQELYEIQQVSNNEYNKNQDLEILDEQEHEKEN